MQPASVSEAARLGWGRRNASGSANSTSIAFVSLRLSVTFDGVGTGGYRLPELSGRALRARNQRRLRRTVPGAREEGWR